MYLCCWKIIRHSILEFNSPVSEKKEKCSEVMGRLEKEGEERKRTGKNKLAKSKKYQRLQETGRIGKGNMKM